MQDLGSAQAIFQSGFFGERVSLYCLLDLNIWDFYLIFLKK